MAERRLVLYRAAAKGPPGSPTLRLRGSGGRSENRFIPSRRYAGDRHSPDGLLVLELKEAHVLHRRGPRGALDGPPVGCGASALLKKDEDRRH